MTTTSEPTALPRPEQCCGENTDLELGLGDVYERHRPEDDRRDAAEPLRKTLASQVANSSEDFRSSKVVGVGLPVGAAPSGGLLETEGIWEWSLRGKMRPIM